MKIISPFCARLLLALLLTVMAGNCFGRTALYGVRCDSLVLPPDSLRHAPLPQREARKAKKLAAKADTDARDTLRLTAIDSLSQTPADTAALSKATARAMKRAKKFMKQRQFVPDPKRALWLSLVLPGAGQIYNRKYWKLPFIYGGFLGCTYALLWNQQMYRDYSQAYLDIMDDDPNTRSYMEMLPPRYDISGREEHFKSIFKRKKDFYRRNRDLSIFCFAGVYLLSVIDAYVDAQLSVFDITPDLSLRIEPAVIETPGTKKNGAYGVGCSFNF